MKKKHLKDAAEIVLAGIDAVDPVDGPRMFPSSAPMTGGRRKRQFTAIYRGEPVEITVRAPRPGPPPDTWTVYASGGEYQVTAGDVCGAAEQYLDRHPGETVLAVVADAMSPGLVVKENP